MSERLCKMCAFFAPAHTCIEKPTWGHCLKLVQAQSGCGAGPTRPRFTWADSHCNDFQPRQQSSVRR